MDEKSTGSYYTPESLVKYMVNYTKQRNEIHRILEPSFGDGRFVEQLIDFNCSITAVEIDLEKVKFLDDKGFKNVDIIHSDFIEYAISNDSTFDLVIGNPPYICKKSISKDKRDLSLNLIKGLSLPESLFQNLWVSFILGSLKMLTKKGMIFLILPFEFLQVYYAEKLRNYLETKFNTIEIITFEEPVFKDIEQDVCLVFMTNEEQAKPYVKYTTMNNCRDFSIVYESVIMRNKPINKWSNSILDDSETDLLLGLSTQFPQIKDFGYISPGIVTGANSFFIINQEIATKLNVINECLYIIQKSANVQNKLIIRLEDYTRLLTNSYNVLLLNLNNINESSFSLNLLSYIHEGEDKKINERYKCSIRNRWYDVPIIYPGDLCFFKRFDDMPRIIVNEPYLYTTDISYNVQLGFGYDKYSFAFCFYNSLTLALCEYSGRFYGGGVGELVPNEFKNLRIPYKEIPMSEVKKLDNMLRNEEDHCNIIEFVDSVVLDFLSNRQRDELINIRGKYINRRLKFSRRRGNENGL